MWPSSATQQQMSMLMYSTQHYAGPQDVYQHAAVAAATAAGFESWAVAQQAAQGYIPLKQPPHHMMQPHMAAAHGIPHMIPITQHHFMPGAHMTMAQQQPNTAAGLMMAWPPHAAPNMHPPPAANGATPGAHNSRRFDESSSRSSSSQNSSGRRPGPGEHGGFRIQGMAASAGQQQYSNAGRVAGKMRRNMVLNTKPGDCSDAAVEEFAMAVRRTPVQEQLDQQLLLDGLRNLDSRGLAALLKELARGHQGRRAREIFDFLRTLPAEHHLAQLCDVFTYTAMVSLCVDQQELARAFELVAEMKQRNVERNVHTYTALMNVAIKCGQLQKALEVYNDLLREGCIPNVVTYNTLIDVHGKTGQWAEALKVMEHMNASNTKPVTRTYNTLMIACNTSGQWQEALNVYGDMVRRGHVPNTTTYNALISAHSKAGRLEKVMDVYQEMLRSGCERSVITYSALISACEKAGQWQLAVNLFNEMLKDKCSPNVITYNSLITACAQGAQWAKAAEVFQQMQASGCRPDVVTYTALVSAYERGGQWMKALEVFQQMSSQRCNPDAILYNTLLDVLWDTGIPWAQHKAAQLFRQAISEGHFRLLPQPSGPQPGSFSGLGPDTQAGHKPSGLQPGSPSGASAASGSPMAGSAAAAPTKLELGLQGVSPRVAMLMMHCWFADLRDYVQQQQQQQDNCLPDRILISTGRSRQRDHISGILRDSITALLASWQSPFVPSKADSSINAESSTSSGSSSKIEASGSAVAEWLLQAEVQQLLQPFSNKDRTSSSSRNTAELAAEAALEKRCKDAINAVKTFENTHNLSVQSMGLSYTSARPGLVAVLLNAGEDLGVRNDVVHDAVLLMDRAMSASFKVDEDAFMCMAAACLLLTLSNASLPTSAPALADICSAVGCSSCKQAESMVGQLKEVMQGDTSSISALRCLKLYLERLGHNFHPDGTCSNQEAIADILSLISRTATDNEFLNYRPTITASAVLYCDRLTKGLLPFWPSSLAGLTGYSNARTPELAAAINGAQRLIKQMASSQQECSSGVTAAGGKADVPATKAAAFTEEEQSRQPAAATEASLACSAPGAKAPASEIDNVTGKLATTSLSEAAAAAAGASP